MQTFSSMRAGTVFSFAHHCRIIERKKEGRKEGKERGRQGSMLTDLKTASKNIIFRVKIDM